MTRLICGVLRLDGRAADTAAVDRMLRAMSPPGLAVDRATATDGPVALGVLTLAPRGEAPPPARILPAGDGLLAADARLYPREGMPAPAAASDLALARALSDPAAGAPATLHGDFAYARWDRAARRLTLARDHLGVRPLKYCRAPGRHVAFASLVPALLEAGLAGRELDDEVLACFLANHESFSGRTFHRGIADLPPAHRLEIGSDGAPVLSRYWRLGLSPRLPAGIDSAAVAAELHRLLDQAVRRRIPPRGPVVGELSGGLDSGAIAVLAARAVAADGRRYVGHAFVEAPRADGLRFRDESPLIAATAAAEPNIEVEAFHWPAIRPASFDVLTAGPFPADPAEVPTVAVRRAAERGALTILSGWGGNEVASWRGAASHAELFWRGMWRRLGDQLAGESRALGRSRVRVFAARVGLQSLPPAARWHVRRWLGLPDSGLAAAQTPFAAAHRRHMLREDETPQHIDSAANRRAALENPWVEKRLAQEAATAARFGTTYSYPMLDRDLVEYAVSMPGFLYRAGGQPRAIFRQAMAGVLPDAVRLDAGPVTGHPCYFLNAVEGRDVILDELEKAAASKLVRDFIDVDAARRHVGSWPGAAEVRRRIEAAADGADADLAPAAQVDLVLYLARFLRTAEAAVDDASPSQRGADAGVPLAGTGADAG